MIKQEIEFVYAVKRYDLFKLAFPHGLVLMDEDPEVHDVRRYIERIRTKGFFVERRAAEQDSSLKQIITYTLVVCDSEILIFQRLRGGGEPRLHGKLGIGIGGHINPKDSLDQDLLTACAVRELNEELYLPDGIPYIVGLVNDESNPVGSVHFGLIYLLRLEKPEASVREHDQLMGTFVPIGRVNEMARHGADLEAWTALIVPRLDEILSVRNQ